MPFVNRKQRRPERQERAVAKDIGGSRVPASGALPHMPGDATNGTYLIDTKETDRSFTLSARVIKKICAEAASKGKVPMLQVDLNSLPVHQRRWAVIPYNEWLELNGYLDE